MPERQWLTRGSEGKARDFLAGQLTFGLLSVLSVLAFHAVAAGAERAVIYYSPG